MPVTLPPALTSNANDPAVQKDLDALQRLIVTQLNNIEAQLVTKSNDVVFAVNQNYLNTVFAVNASSTKSQAQLDQLITLQTNANNGSQADQFNQQLFLAHATAFSLAFLCGMFTWRLTVLAKNQRSFW